MGMLRYLIETIRRCFRANDCCQVNEWYQGIRKKGKFQVTRLSRFNHDNPILHLLSTLTPTRYWWRERRNDVARSLGKGQTSRLMETITLFGEWTSDPPQDEPFRAVLFRPVPFLFRAELLLSRRAHVSGRENLLSFILRARTTWITLPDWDPVLSLLPPFQSRSK